MEIVKYKPAYFEEYFDMARALFPDYSVGQLRKDLQHITSSGKHQAFLAMEDGQPSGFVNVSVRRDYVEGATTSPVGYLEALYVKPGYRKRGVGCKLARTAEAWALARGCAQMGSDTWESHKDGISFHHKMGFRQEDILVHFIKDL